MGRVMVYVQMHAQHSNSLLIWMPLVTMEDAQIDSLTDQSSQRDGLGKNARYIQENYFTKNLLC